MHIGIKSSGGYSSLSNHQHTDLNSAEGLLHGVAAESVAAPSLAGDEGGTMRFRVPPVARVLGSCRSHPEILITDRHGTG